jgi:hypothetical protein
MGIGAPGSAVGKGTGVMERGGVFVKSNGLVLTALIAAMAFCALAPASAPAQVMPGGLLAEAADSQPLDLVRVPAASFAWDNEVRPSASASPGVVEIAQYGAPEEMATFRNGGFKAVRFDPPFAPPYVISKIRFPSLTTNGAPARFLSVRLSDSDQPLVV